MMTIWGSSPTRSTAPCDLLWSVRSAASAVAAIGLLSGCLAPTAVAEPQEQLAPGGSGGSAVCRPDDAGGVEATRAPEITPDQGPNVQAEKGGPPKPLSGEILKALADFNRGAALMEQYRYTDAAKAFEAVLQRAPDWTAARFNLGLAYFNMHGQAGAGDHLATARKTFEAILQAHPDHLHARFCLGLYHQYLGDNQQALECFERVYRSVPNDPYTAYKYGETLVNLGRNEEGTAVLEKVIELDPGFITAVYRLAMQYRRMKQVEKALPLLSRFTELKSAELTGGSFTVAKTYGTSGKYYMVLGADNLPLPPTEPPPNVRIVFSPDVKALGTRVHSWKWPGGSVGLPGIAAADIDADGDLDLCLTAVGKRDETSLWWNDGRGRFSAGPTLADQGTSPCFGDVDNDGDLDLWLGRAGPDVLLENQGKGRFGKAEFSSIAGPDGLTGCARLVDLDSDGDLDLLAFRIAAGSVPARGRSVPVPSSVYNNNRDGTFENVAEKVGLALADVPVAAVVYDDFDNDRDLDLVVFPAGNRRPIAWVNDRAGRYRILDETATGLAASGSLSATSGDPNKDGRRDLLVFTGEAVQLYLGGDGFRFQPDQDFANRFGRLGGTGGQFADMDNDGDMDVIIADAHRRDGTRGPVLLINDWPGERFIDAATVDPGNLLGAIRTEGDASCVVADFTGNGRCDVLLAPDGREPLLIENLTPGGHYIQLDLVGTRGQDKKSRSNNSAIGARVEVKAGTVFQQFVVGSPAGPVAMSPLRIHAGLGTNPKVEWLRILWPDAVLQAELEVPADQVKTVAELPRKTSSCPYLFAWNGSRFEFVSDFGGVGGLGYMTAPGVYATPDPTEYLVVPGLKPLGSEYVLKAISPLEEVTYFDEAKLIAVDHPAGTQVYPHEMMSVSAAPPPFEVFCFQRPIDPLRAVDHRGVDVTREVLRIDRRYAGATRPDDRFIGLAEDHFVELDFGDQLSRTPADSRLVLFLYGWVEYGYSSTNYAASQAGVRLRAPSIHVLRNGQWVELFREVGYPAGLQHMMTLDVTGMILPGDRRLRISSNMEVYWDRIFLAVHLGDVVSLTEVEAGSADLHFAGYPRAYCPDGRRPNLYDYDNLDGTAAWKLISGDYTRYGEVGELLSEADDCFVIMGRGEELTLRFAAGAFGPVPEGKHRTFILKTDSYCKDMDLYTAHPDTVEPLPFHAMSGYPYGPEQRYPETEKTKNLRLRYNTRRLPAGY